MKNKKLFLLLGFSLLVLIFILVKCGKNHTAQNGHEHGTETSHHSEEGEHEHDEENSGATFREGKGIELMDETKQALGLELVQVNEISFTPSISLNAQIYRAAVEVSRKYGKERSGFAYATALVTSDIANQFQLGQKFPFSLKQGGSSYEGIVWKVDETQVPILGKAEVLLELPDPDHSLPVGTFIEAHISYGKGSQKTIGVPPSSILQTSTGTFIYVQNGDSLLRTEIEIGMKNSEYIEVIKGLSKGATIVMKPVENLYLIELRATKGGGHSH